MSRLLCIDVGKKRCGIAVTDPLQLIATGLTCVPTKELMPFLKNYLAQEDVSRFIVGKPVDLQNRPTDATALAEAVVKALSKTYKDIPISRVDERFTSKLAKAAILQSGIKKQARRNNKGLVDEVSAVIMLQSYMNAVS